MGKNFKLKAEEIRRIIPYMGYCIASDMITVDGKPVGYMYRENPTEEADSGWCFFSGSETEEYSNVGSNFGICDVNTICNYDPSIVPYLTEPHGQEFVREGTSGPFTRKPLRAE